MANPPKPITDSSKPPSFSSAMPDPEKLGTTLGKIISQVPPQALDTFFQRDINNDHQVLEGSAPQQHAGNQETTEVAEIAKGNKNQEDVGTETNVQEKGAPELNAKTTEVVEATAAPTQGINEEEVINEDGGEIIEVQKPAADHQGIIIQEEIIETTQVVPEIKAAKQVIQEEERETTEEKVEDQKAAPKERSETSKVEETAAPKDQEVNEQDHTETTETATGKVIEEEKKNEVPETETATDQEDPEIAAEVNQMSREERIERDKQMIVNHLKSVVKMTPSKKSSYS